MHIRGMASLAAGLNVLFRKQRPQPVLVIAVRFFDAGGSAAIALVAGRATEFVGIMGLQQFRLGMAGEGARVLVRLLLALAVMTAAVISQRLAGIHVAGLAAVHDIGVRHVDLHDLGVPLFGLLFQAINLGGREVHHVV